MTEESLAAVKAAMAVLDGVSKPLADEAASLRQASVREEPACPLLRQLYFTVLALSNGAGDALKLAGEIIEEAGS